MKKILLLSSFFFIFLINAQTEENNYLQDYKRVYFSKNYDELDSLKLVMLKYSESQDPVIKKSIPGILKEINEKQKNIDFDKYLKKQGDDRKDRILKKYGQKVGGKLIRREIKIGMSYEMVADSLGDPDDIYDSETRYHHGSQWVYRSSMGDKYYYFENGKLVVIQD